MRIKEKLLGTLMGMSFLVALVGGFAVNRQYSIVYFGATKGTEAVAHVLGCVFEADSDPAHAFTAKVISRLHQTLGSDFQIVGRDGTIAVDADPAEVGTPAPDPEGAIARTLRDGQPRTYIEGDRAHPAGIRQIVAPMRSQSGQMMGVVTLEYTQLYNEMTALTNATSRQVVLAALASAVIAAWLAYYIGTSNARPLRQLTKAATAFAAGRSDAPMPAPRKDEIGDLTIAFNTMMERREQTREELTRARDELAAEREKFADLLNTIPATVFEHFFSVDAGQNFVNRYVEQMYGYTPQEWLSTPDFWLSRVHPEERDRVSARAARRYAGEGGNEGIETYRWVTKDDRVIWVETHLAIIRNPVNGSVGVRGFSLDVTEQKNAEQELEKAHQELLESSRHVGMADVATNVLHNVGNVLNSVNISATLATDQVRQSSGPHLGQVAGLLRENGANLGAYLESDPIGKKLPGFITQLAAQLDVEQAAVLKELEQLRKDVEHIKDIVAVQQSYASVSGMSQTVPIVDLVEDSLRMNAGALARHDVQLIRAFEVRPTIEVDKHKVMQILVNLIRNAKYACDEGGLPDKQLTVRVAKDERFARISVIDNGVGIPPQNMTRIFSHGFTTRKTGHGFGLHSSALAAREIGGALLAHSDGPGRGATFTLELPLQSTKSNHGS